LGFLVSCGSGGGGDTSFLQPPSPTTPPGDDQTKWSTAIFEEPLISAGNPVTIQIISSPAIAPDGTIYVGSTDNKLYALKADGTVKWTYLTGDQIVASPAIGSDGTVYVGSADRQFYAINPDGSLKWIYPTKDVLTSSAALGTDGTIYVGGTNLDYTIFCAAEPIRVKLGTLYAINPDGTLKWDITLSGAVNSSPAIASDGIIYIGSAGDILYDRINRCDKATEFPSSDVYPCYPVNGHVYAINPDGTLKWDFKTLGDVDSSAAIGADGTIYIGSDYATGAYGDDKTVWITIGSATTGYLYAINPNGTLKWFTDLFGDVKSSPAIGGDGTIYVGSDKEDVFALNPDNGEIIWQYPTRGAVRSSPALTADGTIYIGSNDASLYALNPDGTLKFRFIATDASSVTSSPAVIANGMVYFVSGPPLKPDAPFVSGTPVLHALSCSSPLAETVWPKFRRDLLNMGRQ
jgi:outer membrane protein assembly factor BamB